MDLQHFLEGPLNLKVFLGKDTLPFEEWQKTILDLIRKSDIFIAIVGKKWAKPDKNDNRHDINNAKDIVRMEVILGLENVGNCGVVLLGGFKLKATNLPAELKSLPDLQWASANSRFRTGDGIGKLTAKMHQICDKLQPKPIVLLSSTLAFLGDKETTDGLTYFVTLVVTLVHTIMGPEREVILKVPPYGDRKASKPAKEFQCELLEEIVENYERYSGIIIAPFDTESLRGGLVKLLKKPPILPIATIDKTYRSDSDSEFFLREGIQSPPGVACDGQHNGGLAADCVIDYIEQAKIKEPNVVILQGLEGSADRIVGFIDRINRHNADSKEDNKIHVSVSHYMDFLGEKARDWAESYLRPNARWESLNDERYMSMLKNQPQKHQAKVREVHVFFCCNDEMALGACEALESAFRRGHLHPTVVVGFDGIPEALRRIDDGDHWLLNTIDVKVEEQVHELKIRFLPAVEKHTRMTGVELVKGRPFVKDQSRHIESILGWRKREKKRIEARKRRLSKENGRHPPPPKRRGMNGVRGLSLRQQDQ